MIVSWNDSLMEADEVKISCSDATFLRGEGVFETIRAIESSPLYWADHYGRLKSSAKRLGLDVPSETVLRSRIEKVLGMNDLADARVRVTVGENCLITTESLNPEVLGASVVLGGKFPINEKSPLAGIKCTSYAENMTLLRFSKSEEMIRPNMKGELCEGCISNVFFLKGGKVFTPSLETGCLPGVMRGQVISKVSVKEGRWPFEIVSEADEIWLSNSINRLKCVRDLDGEVRPEPSDLFHELRSQIA